MDKGDEKKELLPLTSTSEIGSSGKSDPFTDEKSCIAHLYSECWFCDSGKAKVVNVLGADDKSIDQMQEPGLMNFDPRSDNDNAIGLCDSCSSAMKDKTSPGIIFIPYSLQFFIDFEKADQSRRLNTDQSSRVCPCAADYEAAVPATQPRDRPKFSQGEVYTRYVLRDSGSDESDRPTIGKYPGKEWNGAPITAIKRAWLANGTPLRAKTPREMSNQLDELLDLYLERVGLIASNRESQQGPSRVEGISKAQKCQKIRKKAPRPRMRRVPPLSQGGKARIQKIWSIFTKGSK